MNSVYNSSSDICCTNKEQCFTPTLLSWSSIQLSPKSFTNSMTETGKFYRYKHTNIYDKKTFNERAYYLLNTDYAFKNLIIIQTKPNTADYEIVSKFDYICFQQLFSHSNTPSSFPYLNRWQDWYDCFFFSLEYVGQQLTLTNFVWLYTWFLSFVINKYICCFSSLLHYGASTAITKNEDNNKVWPWNFHRKMPFFSWLPSLAHVRHIENVAQCNWTCEKWIISIQIN